MTQPELKQKWQEVLELIKEKISQVAFDLWFKTINAIGFAKNNELILIVSSTFAINSIQKHHKEVLKDSLKIVFQEDIEFTLIRAEDYASIDEKQSLNNISVIQLKPMKERLINYSQRKILQYNLTAQDLFILNWLEDFIKSGNMRLFSEKDENGNTIHYYWVDRKKILSDMPFLNIKESWLKKIFQKLEDKGIIVRKVIKNKQYVYVKWHLIYFDRTYYEYEVKPYLEKNPRPNNVTIL